MVDDLDSWIIEDSLLLGCIILLELEICSGWFVCLFVDCFWLEVGFDFEENYWRSDY